MLSVKTQVVDGEYDTCDSLDSRHRIYLNPCMFIGRKEYLLLRDGIVVSHKLPESAEFVILEGSGNSSECAILIEEMIWPSSDEGQAQCREIGDSCPLDGVVHPPMVDLHFFGMVRLYTTLVLCRF